MDMIKEFLLDNTSSNLNVIITAIISTILTTFIIKIYETMWNKLKILFNKAIQYIKNKANEFKLKINVRKDFRRLYKEYKKDKSIYNIEKEIHLALNEKYLRKKQKRVFKMVREENKDILGKEYKEITERMKAVVDYNQDYLKSIHQKNL